MNTWLLLLFILCIGIEIYEASKIYNSINRAKIINFCTLLRSKTISVIQLFVNMHFTFLFTYPGTMSAYNFVDNPTDESLYYLQIFT